MNMNVQTCFIGPSFELDQRLRLTAIPCFVGRGMSSLKRNLSIMKGEQLFSGLQNQIQIYLHRSRTLSAFQLFGRMDGCSRQENLRICGYGNVTGNVNQLKKLSNLRHDFRLYPILGIRNGRE